jgi:Transposase DDE domain group 1/Bacterial regulatory proteins, tetR family
MYLMAEQVKRQYESARRQEQARETRLRIVAAARDLFVTKGYGRTTMADVARGLQMLQAEGQHRDHAIVEQVIADAAASALAHLPSGAFNANAAASVLWAIAHNLTRAAGTLAGPLHARATTATIRTHLINVPARVARSARRVTLHLPKRWPWEPAWSALHTAVHRPPRRTP